jgi:hypothetical protein
MRSSRCMSADRTFYSLQIFLEAMTTSVSYFLTHFNGSSYSELVHLLLLSACGDILENSKTLGKSLRLRTILTFLIRRI